MTDPTEVKQTTCWGEHAYVVPQFVGCRMVTGRVVSVPSVPWVLFGVRKLPQEGALHVEEITTGLYIPGVAPRSLRALDGALRAKLRKEYGRDWLVKFLNAIDRQSKVNRVTWPHLRREQSRKNSSRP